MPFFKHNTALDARASQSRTVAEEDGNAEPPASGVRRIGAGAMRPQRLIDTEDIAEAQRIFARVYGEATLEPTTDQPFGCVLDVAGHGPIRVVQGRWRSGLRIAMPRGDERYILTLSAGGHLEGEHAGAPVTAIPGRAGGIFSPGRPASVQGGPAYRGLTFTFERGAIEAHFRTLTGREPREQILFEPALSLEDSASRALYDLLQIFRSEVQRPDSSPLWLTTLRDAVLTSLLTNTRHGASALLHAPPPRVAPGCVRRAEEYISAHAGEPLTLADIVAVAGVPARSLRAAFAASRGLGPMEFLKHCRLDLGRRMLLERAPGTSVATVVHALGLSAAGRFSVEYRKRFGESPSETLAAGRGGPSSQRFEARCAGDDARRTSIGR